MRGGGRSLAYHHPENLLPGLNNQVQMSSSFWFDWDYLHPGDCCLTGMLHQVSVRFWPGLWRGSEGIASREELLLVMRDVEQVGHRIHLLFILDHGMLPVVDPSSTPLRGSG